MNIMIYELQLFISYKNVYEKDQSLIALCNCHIVQVGSHLLLLFQALFKVCIANNSTSHCFLYIHIKQPFVIL